MNNEKLILIILFLVGSFLLALLSFLRPKHFGLHNSFNKHLLNLPCCILLALYGLFLRLSDSIPPLLFQDPIELVFESPETLFFRVEEGFRQFGLRVESGFGDCLGAVTDWPGANTVTVLLFGLAVELVQVFKLLNGVNWGD